MNTNPLVTIIITTYNSSKTILNTLESVYNQSYKNFEVLIYDDCSTDNTLQIINNFFKQYDFCFKLGISTLNYGGPANGRNWGIVNSNGKYLCFLDADDIWESNKLEIQISFMEKQQFTATGTRCLSKPKFSFWILKGKINMWQMLMRNRMILSSSMVNRKFLIENDIYFDPKKSFNGVEDYAFFLNLLNKGGSIYILSNKLIQYSINYDSLSHSNYELNELRRLEVIKELETNNYKIIFLIKFVVIIYKCKLKIWNLM